MQLQRFRSLPPALLLSLAPAVPAQDGGPLPHESPHPRVSDPDRFLTDRVGALELPLPEEKDAFFFAVFGDRTGGPRDGVKVLAEAVEEVNLLEPDLVMTVGDLVQGYNQRPEWMEEMREFRGIMGRLKMPWFPVPGNHDIYWRGPDKPPEEHEADYEEHFGPLWYAFEHKDCWFIALFSDELDPASGLRDFGRPECHVMSPEQYAWLDETLVRTAGARHVFVFLHHPRWLGGQYGDDWERVHARLAEAGNVRAVFAGHIHRMRYDGRRDGIEYLTLATVGGGQHGDLPQAGWLHQYHLVTVRGERIAMASYPVGSAFDPRDVEGEMADEVRALTGRLRPVHVERPAVGAGLAVDGSSGVRFHNTSGRPLELTLGLESEDSRWLFLPDHAHSVLAPGEEKTFAFQVLRNRSELDATFRLPYVHVAADYLGEKVRVELPRKLVELPLDVTELPPPPRPAVEHALRLDGRDDAVALAADAFELADGPFTVEGWLRAEAFAERQGFINKTEGSEFGLFVSAGKPSFLVHLAGAYVTAEPGAAVLATGRWHHLAGVFDGSEVRLYVDGRRVAAVPGAGSRRPNELPLMVGADVDSGGNPTSLLRGLVDEVRISSAARYEGGSFTPARRFEADGDTVLLLHFDGPRGPWVFDGSQARRHARLVGGPAVVPAE